MTTRDVKEYMNNNRDVSPIDMRASEEVKAGKIPRVVNIPLGFIEFRLEGIDKSKEHILVCQSSKRSGMAANLLESLGYQVINMDGGMSEWDGQIE